MRTQTAGKVLLLALLGLATSSVMAEGDKRASRSKAPKAPSAAARNQEQPSGSFRVLSGRPLDDGPRVGRGPIVQDGVTSIGTVSVQPEGEGLFRVTGQASVGYRLGDSAFVWSLRVREAGTAATIIEKIYDDQIFTPAAGETVFPCSFEEIVPIEVGPGSYRIELTIHRVPQDGTESLKDPEVKKAHLLARSTSYLTVSPE